MSGESLDEWEVVGDAMREPNPYDAARAESDLAFIAKESPLSITETVCELLDREQWLAERRKGIGSSDAAAILGISPFKSALAVYVDKTSQAIDKEESEAMKWGKLLEPLIIQNFAQETGRYVEPASTLIRNRARPWQIATLDAIQAKSIDSFSNHGALEVKAAGWRIGDWTEGIPDHVMAQAQHQLAVTGYNWGSVVVLERGCKLLWADFERNDQFIDEILIPAEEEFWRRVAEGIPVQPDGSPSARAALKALYPSAKEAKVVTLPGEFIDLDKEREKLHEELVERENRKELIDQQIIAAIGDAEIGSLLNGIEYRYRSQNRKGYTVEPTTFRALRRHASTGEK